MAKSWDELSYFRKDKELRNLADQLGIDMNEYSRNNYDRHGLKSYEDLEQDIAKAAANNYDYRESLAAGKASGNKHFKDIGDGISNMSEAWAVHKGMHNVYKDNGNGGNYSSENDRANVAKSLNADYHESIMDDIKSDISDDVSGRDDDEGSGGSSGRQMSNKTYNDWLAETGKATPAFSASAMAGAGVQPTSDLTSTEDYANRMLQERMKGITGDRNLLEKGKFNQGAYVLANLGSKEFSSTGGA